MCFKRKSSAKIPFFTCCKGFGIGAAPLDQRLCEFVCSAIDGYVFLTHPELDPVSRISSIMVTLNSQPKIFMEFVFTPDWRSGVRHSISIDGSIDIRSGERASPNRQRFCTNTSIIAYIIAKSPNCFYPR